MESRIRIVNVKLVVCFILVGLLGTSRQYDSNCMIRFYAVQQCQCPCWSFNGTNWNYSSDTHKYSDEVVSPSRSNFGFKCIRTFSNDFYQEYPYSYEVDEHTTNVGEKSSTPTDLIENSTKTEDPFLYATVATTDLAVYELLYEANGNAAFQQNATPKIDLNTNSNKTVPNTPKRNLFVFHAVIVKIVITTIVVYLGIIGIYSCIWMCRRQSTFQISHPRIA